MTNFNYISTNIFKEVTYAASIFVLHKIMFQTTSPHSWFQLGIFQLPCQIYFQGSYGNITCKQLSAHYQKYKPGCSLTEARKLILSRQAQKDGPPIRPVCNSALHTASKYIRKATPLNKDVHSKCFQQARPDGMKQSHFFSIGISMNIVLVKCSAITAICQMK